MAKVCAVCHESISMLSTRYPTKDKQVLCKKCFKKYDYSMMDIQKMTVNQIVSGDSVFETKLDKTQRREFDKAETAETKQLFKEWTAGKPVVGMLIRQDTSNTFKSNSLSLSFDQVVQHLPGRIIINNKKEYVLKKYDWTPNIVGQKSFSMGKALTGAALIGEAGLLAGASGKKGEDKSYATLLLQDIESGEVVKMTGDVSVKEAEKLANFITAEELE